MAERELREGRLAESEVRENCVRQKLESWGLLSGERTKRSRVKYKF
jgi:hypothetical protein